MKSTQIKESDFCLKPSDPGNCGNCNSIDNETSEGCKKLSNISLTSALFLFVQCIAMVILIYTTPKYGDYAIGLTISSIVLNGDDSIGAKLTTQINLLVTVYMAWLCVAFFLISAISQLLQGMHGFQEVVKMQVNFVRWIEYGITSSIMICVILGFVGIREFVAFVCVFSLNLTMNALGCLMELMNRVVPQGKGAMWFPFYLGCWTSLVPWTCIVFALSCGGSPPGFVYVLFVGYFILHLFFPMNMAWRFVQETHSPENGVLIAERNYIVLGFVSKTLLNWTVFGGLSQTITS
jgi:hypothetical protein